jgi:hypothetical protein
VTSVTTFAARAPRVVSFANPHRRRNEVLVSTVHRHIVVDAPSSVTQATWSHFASQVITGHQRLACDELACVDAVRAGLVTFEPAGDGSRTTVAFTIERDGDEGPAREILEQNVARDLVLFKDYVERSGGRTGGSKTAAKKALVEDEERHTHEALHRRIGAEDEAVSYGDHFPT